MKWRLVWICGVLLLWLWCSPPALAGALAARLDQYPNWQMKPLAQTARGDLIYPNWFSGDWTVKTTLVDLQAPLAPDLITPGFESNRELLDQSIAFQVRFIESQNLQMNGIALPIPIPVIFHEMPRQIISDRAFNGLNLAKAYLGDRTVVDVRVDPKNPNRQITLLTDNRQLVSTIVARSTEAPAPNQFITTEIFRQEFRGSSQLYFNEVETTTSYQQALSQPTNNPEAPVITADQVTAIYLSPQDPDFFKAGDRPVALYRYRLEFFPPSLG
ncbi:MAG TPA: hypothetical protein V6C78_02480 [Crinalium sp.]|jgi:hypothetical protein